MCVLWTRNLKLFLRDDFSAFRENFNFAEIGKGKDGWSVEVRAGYREIHFFVWEGLFYLVVF
jgi:hypothetical protein